MIDKLFMVCVKFLMALGRYTHLTYKQISVVLYLVLIGFDTVLTYVLYK